MRSESGLLLVTLPIVANAKEITFEATMAARRQVPLNAAKLTLDPTTTRLAVKPLAASRWRSWSRRTGLVARGRWRLLLGTTGTPAKSSVRRRALRVDSDRAASSEPLLRVKEAGIEITRWHRSVASIDVFPQRGIVLVKAIEKE